MKAKMTSFNRETLMVALKEIEGRNAPVYDGVKSIVVERMNIRKSDADSTGGTQENSRRREVSESVENCNRTELDENPQPSKYWYRSVTLSNGRATCSKCSTRK